MQLQGEMSASAAKVYKNPIQGMAVIFKNEGIKGLQKGLNAAYIYQIGLNGSRLGFYEPIRTSLNQLFFPGQEPHKVQSVGVNVVSGATSGIIGAVVGSPLFLVKTRLQSYSEFIKIGEQTHYTGVWNGLVTIFKTEGVKAVSYTHLDVYKRQVNRWPFKFSLAQIHYSCGGLTQDVQAEDKRPKV